MNYGAWLLYRAKEIVMGSRGKLTKHNVWLALRFYGICSFLYNIPIGLALFHFTYLPEWLIVIGYTAVSFFATTYVIYSKSDLKKGNRSKRVRAS